MSVGETYGRSPLRPTVGRLDDLPWVAEAIHGGPKEAFQTRWLCGSGEGLSDKRKRGPSVRWGRGASLEVKTKGLGSGKGAIPALRRCANERSRMPAECSPELHAGVLPPLRSSWVGLDGSPLCWQAG